MKTLPPLLFNQTLFETVPSDVRSILEIGCSDGALGCALKQRDDLATCRYVGMDTNEKKAALARERLDAFYLQDAEEFDYHRLGETFDCMLFADSLEHMKDPKALLKRLLPHLKLGGHLLVCIPNVRHFSIVDQLIRGHFEYTPEGLMDKTHYHFFTLKTALKLFFSLGLQVKEITPLIKDAAWIQRMGSPAQMHPDFIKRFEEALAKLEKQEPLAPCFEAWFPGMQLKESDAADMLSAQFVIHTQKQKA